MNKHLLKQLKHSISIFVLAILFVACSASQGTKNYAVSTEGIIQAQVSNMHKDAIRLKGKLMSKGSKVSDRLQYDFVVTEVVKYGATFATAEPKVGEELVLITPGEVKFRKNNEILVDVLTPINRSEGKLTVNMVTE